MIYYIADTHLRDQAIFDKCKRPFKSLEEMENTINLAIYAGWEAANV